MAKALTISLMQHARLHRSGAGVGLTDLSPKMIQDIFTSNYKLKNVIDKNLDKLDLDMLLIIKISIIG
ncbi:hypothetical protein H5410_040055 [Solanum commersonii]|uniref:Uncharacterized protein n=1 Tax=Solanum commersonii TaxID=4109 RepID=A0A9J5XNZ5_SOLCO|nr:hypothetical protein H5410_040055 [Solanum commersonii]